MTRNGLTKETDPACDAGPESCLSWQLLRSGADRQDRFSRLLCDEEPASREIVRTAWEVRRALECQTARPGEAYSPLLARAERC